MRKIVIACDSFKGSLTSREAGIAAAEGIRAVMCDSDCDVTVAAVGDGGEGTLEAIVAEKNGSTLHATVQNPMGNPVKAKYGICGDLAVIEMAEASGLNLVASEERNPLRSTSYGTGQLIAEAIKAGCRKFLMGLGGSATNDGGTGMLRALGFRFIDISGNEITNDILKLTELAEIDCSNAIPELKDCTFTSMCDVNAPLTGPNGASYIFGPQKGADPDMVQKLDNALSQLAKITAMQFGKDFEDYPGSGAAGGMGFALLAFLNARMRSGIDVVLDSIDFERKIADASLIITGEGRIDSQTSKGKTPFGILKRAKNAGVPVIAIGGSIDREAIPELLEAGFKDIIAVTPPYMPLAQAMLPTVAKDNIRNAIMRYFRQYIE